MGSAALWIALACLALGALFSALHLCLVHLSPAGLEDRAEAHRGARARARVQRILADAPGHARALAAARATFNTACAIAAVWASASLRGEQLPGLVDCGIALAVAAGGQWVFGVIIPESIADHAAEPFVLALAPLVRAAYLTLAPLVPLARAADALIRRMAGTPAQAKHDELADELLSVVENVERSGAIDEGEARMIGAVVNFKDRTVEQIMTPRTEVEALALTNNLGVVTAFVRKARHSRIPVYKAGGTLDDIVGFFYVKDLLRWLAGGGGGETAAGGKAFDLKHIIRPAMFVPATKTIRALTEEFVAKKVHIAVVADEYGGVAGLVSLEDIVEEVFGEIQDEYEKAEDEPPRIEVKIDPEAPRAGIAEADARAYINDVNEALEPLGVALPEDDEYDTLGGFVLTHLGRIPEVNESFVHGRMQVTVLEATPTRVLRIRVQVRPEDDGGPAENGHEPRPADRRAA